jgi:hypothetical protein
MATIRQYYDSDFRDFVGPEGPVPFEGPNKTSFDPPVMWKMLQGFDSRACFFVCYVPPTAPLGDASAAIIANFDWIFEYKKALKLSVGNANEAANSLDDCVFTKRLIIYVEGLLSDNTKTGLIKQAQARDLALVIRDYIYLRMREERSRPVAFISYDSRDRGDIARPLAVSLTQNLCRVWYDEFSLNPGDSLREKIEKGLKECKRCILILTPHFLSNTGWSKKEFDSVFTRELINKEQVVLPVWAGVTAKDVYEYSPALTDRVGTDWSLGVEEVTRRLLKVLL